MTEIIRKQEVKKQKTKGSSGLGPLKPAKTLEIIKLQNYIIYLEKS